eukprot:g7090.t1
MKGKRKALPHSHDSVKRSNGIMRKGINKVKNYLKIVTLGDYLDARPPSQVVSFDVNTTLSDALLKLDQCNILSAPLFDTMSSEYYGFVDCWDILRQVLKSIDLPKLQAEELPYQLRKLGERLRTETLSVLTELEDGELVYKANKSHSLHEVIHYGFARTHGKRRKSVCHRIAVFDFLDGSKQSSMKSGQNENNTDTSTSSYGISTGGPGGPGGAHLDQCALTETSKSCSELNVKVTDALKVEAVVSQSDMLRFIYQKRELFPELLNMSISDLKISEKPVVCVPVDMLAVHTFASMFAWNVKSAGIVDNHNGGVLVANLSASDLRGIQTADFPVLSTPVLSFLEKRSNRRKHSSDESSPLLQDYGLDEDEQGAYPAADAIYPQASLGEAMEHLVSTGYHRVYVIDHENRTQGIITITDILRLFL